MSAIMDSLFISRAYMPMKAYSFNLYYPLKKQNHYANCAIKQDLEYV